jgi:hypothetical protein
LLDQAFDAPIPFDAVNSDQDDFDLRFSEDGKVAVFGRGSVVSGNVADILVSVRDDNYGGGKQLNGVNGTGGCCADTAPSLSPDGLEIFYHSNDQPPVGTADARLWHATRSNTNADFTGRNLVPGLETLRGFKPLLSHDGKALYFRDLDKGSRLVRSSRIGGQWGTPQDMLQGQTLSAALDGAEHTLYTGRGDGKVYISTRSDVVAPWSDPVLVPELGDGSPSYLTADGCTLYFESTRSHPGGKTGLNVWVARKKKP